MNKKLKYIFFAIIRNIVLLFLASELFFRFVIPASMPPFSEFYENDKLLAYSDRIKNGMFTAGKTVSIRTYWHINNRGWNYPIDYEKTDKKLIAIIGDSFVASNEIDYDKYFPYLLRKKLDKQYEVYSFGYPSSQLAQYLQTSRYVDKYFNPDIIIFTITDNDIKQSIFGSSPNQQFLSIRIDKGRIAKEVVPKPISSLRLYRGVLYRSALFRYVYFNLKFISFINNSAKKHSSDLNDKLFEITTDYLVGRIRHENPDRRIIFVMVPALDIIYDPEAQNTEFYSFDRIVKSACVKYGIEIIDLTLPMREEYKLNKKKFNLGADRHWNEYAHNFTASLLCGYLENRHAKHL